MKYKAPGKCPVCGEKLSIIKLGCPKCSTVIEGDFHPCEFCRLPEEDLSFIKVFIKNRGNIKDIEKELGISYPTVRGKLDAAIRALGYEVVSKQDEEASLREKTQKEEAKSAVLAKLYAGELSAKEAAEQIKAL
jgi:hypothetical protein